MTHPSPFVARADAIALLPPADLDDAYENRKYIPAADEHMAQWQQQSAAFRSNATHAAFDQPYGPAPRQCYDLFWPDGGPGTEKGLLVVVHGGYWLAFSKDDFTHLASGAAAQGWAVAMISYTLAPDARIAEITREMVSAVNTLADIASGPMRLAGHSAGGHLAACLLSEGRVSAAVAISGVFDLEPLVPTSINAALRLDRLEARALSPIHWPAPNGGAPGGTMLDCVVGAEETAEFVRQSRDMAAAWGAKGAQTRFESLPGLNHFTVLSPLTDPDSPLVRRIVDLAKS